MEPETAAATASLGPAHALSALACPFCGGRLLSKTSNRPPRLACAECGELLPQSNLKPPLGLLDHQAPGLLIIAVLLLLPLSLLALSPWVHLPAPRSSERVERRGSGLSHQRWDPRTGVVGRPATTHRQHE